LIGRARLNDGRVVAAREDLVEIAGALRARAAITATLAKAAVAERRPVGRRVDAPVVTAVAAEVVVRPARRDDDERNERAPSQGSLHPRMIAHERARRRIRNRWIRVDSSFRRRIRWGFQRRP